MKDYFCKSRLLSEAEIKVEKLSEDAEYKNKAIIDCENRVQELEKELHDLKLALERNEKAYGTEDCEFKEKSNELNKILMNDMEIQTTFEEKSDMEEGTACEDVKEQFKTAIIEKDKEMKSLKEKLSKLKTGYRAKDQFFNEASEKCMELEFRINEKEIENQEFKSQFDEAKHQMNMLQEALNNKVEELARTGEELAVASIESEQSKRIITELKAKCESLASEMESLKERLQGDTVVQSESALPDMDTMNKELIEKENHVKELIIKLEEMEKGKKILEKKLCENTKILQEAQNKVEQLKVVITEKEDELSMITQAQIRSCEDKEIQVEDLNQGKVNKDIESLKLKLQQTENEKEEQDKQLKEFNDKQTILVGQIKDLEGMKEEILKLESLMNDKEKMCKDLSENLTKLEQKNANLLSELKAEKDATNTIEKLRESILEKDEEIEMFKGNLDATLLELEGKEKIEDGMKKLRKSIEEEKATVICKEKEIAKLTGLNKDLEERLESIGKEESMHDLEAAVVDKEMELCERDRVITEQKSVIDNLNVEIEKLQGEIKICDEKIENKEKEKIIEVSKLEMVLKEKEEFIGKSHSELEEASKEKETLDEKIEDLEKKLCRMAEEMEEKEMKNNSFDKERSRLQEKLEEAWEKIYKLEDEVEERSQQILDSKTNQDEMKQACDDGDQNDEKDMLVKHSELVSDVKRYKDLFETVEAELKEANCELKKVKEQKNVLETQSKEFQDVIEIVNKQLHDKVEELAVQKQLYDSKMNKENANCVSLEAEMREKLNAITLKNTEHVNEIEKYKHRVVSLKENYDKELESLKLKLDQVSTERDRLDKQNCDTKLLKESVNDLESKVSLKVVEIETLQLEVKLLNEELSRVKGEKGIVEEKLQLRESVVDGHDNLNLDCDNASVTKLDELQRLLESEKKKNEEYQKLLTETSEMNCLSPQTGVRKLRKAKIDAENALAEAQYKISSLESKVQDLENKHKCTENSKVNSIMSPNASDFVLQRKLNYFSTKLEESETKNVTMSKEIMELQCTVERLERDLNNERSNFDVTERDIHRRSRVSFMQNDPRQSIGSPSTKVELCKTREREQNLREQLKKSNDTIQEWLSKLTDTENQLKQKRQELKHAQETIQTLEARNSEGEKSTEKEVQQYMELTNELKLQIIRKEGDLEQNSNLIEDLRRQLDNKYSGVKNIEKDVKEKDELITLFKETLKEQESMLDEQAQMVSEKEKELENSQQEYTELMEKYQHLLESKDSFRKKNEGDVRKMARAEAERDLQADRVKELEDKLGQAEQQRSDAERSLKKVEDEKSRLKSALTENNQELKELETNLTDVRRECEELRSQGADKNAAMHLEEAKRDMDKNVHELNVKVRNLQCQNKELSFKLSSAEEKLKSLTEEGKHSGEKEMQRFRDERDKLVSALEACLKKKDTEIKQLKVVIKQLKDKEIQTAQNWHEEREKIAAGLKHLQHGQFVKQEVESPEEDEDVPPTTDLSPVAQENKTVNEDNFSKPTSCPSSTSKSSKSRPPRPAPPSVQESDISTVITKLEASPGSARKSSARRGRKRPSPAGPDDLPPLPKRSSREPLAETSILSEASEDYSSHLQIDATPKAAAKSLKRMRKRTGSVEETQIEEPSTDSSRRGSKRNAKNRLLKSFRESPIGKTSKKLLENIAETFSPIKSPTKSPSKSPRYEDEDLPKSRKRNKPSKENIPVASLENSEKKSSRGKGRHKLYKDDTYISEPFESTGDFIQSPDDVHVKVTRSLRSRKR